MVHACQAVKLVKPPRSLHLPARKLDKAEARLDWGRSAEALARQVRAFNPWPVAETSYQGQTLRVWRSVPLPGGKAAEPGRVMRADREGIDVSTGDGVLRILILQLPGKRALPAADCLNAHQLDGVLLG